MSVEKRKLNRKEAIELFKKMNADILSEFKNSRAPGVKIGKSSIWWKWVEDLVEAGYAHEEQAFNWKSPY